MTGPQFFVNNPREAEIALAMVRNATELLPTLLADDMMVTASLITPLAEFMAQEMTQ